MSYDDWENAQSEYLSKVIDEDIAEQRADSVRSYLGTYGDAVQERVTRCIADAGRLADAGFPSPAVVAAVTAVELIIRYYILRPLAAAGDAPRAGRTACANSSRALCDGRIAYVQGVFVKPA